MKLTKRQLESLSCVSNGLSIDQTAYVMGLSRSSVEKHLAAARERLKARNLYHAIFIAAKTGLVSVMMVSVVLGSFNNDIDMVRRNTRQSRREQYEFLLSPQFC